MKCLAAFAAYLQQSGQMPHATHFHTHFPVSMGNENGSNLGMSSWLICQTFILNDKKNVLRNAQDMMVFINVNLCPQNIW